VRSTFPFPFDRSRFPLLSVTAVSSLRTSLNMWPARSYLSVGNGWQPQGDEFSRYSRNQWKFFSYRNIRHTPIFWRTHASFVNRKMFQIMIVQHCWHLCLGHIQY